MRFGSAEQLKKQVEKKPSNVWRCGDGAQPKAPSAGGILNSDQGKRSLDSAQRVKSEAAAEAAREAAAAAISWRSYKVRVVITLSDVITAMKFAPLNGLFWETLNQTRAKKKATLQTQANNSEQKRPYEIRRGSLRSSKRC